MSEQEVQDLQDASFESCKYEISQSCNKNELFGSDCRKFQQTAQACERKLRGSYLTLPLPSQAMELRGTEQKWNPKMPEWHLDSTIKLGLQDDTSDLDICDLSGAYSSGFYKDKRCSKPLTSTPCSRKKHVKFKLVEDCSLMDDSGYEGSPSSEQESPIISRDRNTEFSRCHFQDSFEEEPSRNLDFNLSNPKLCLLSRFDEPEETDSTDVPYSVSVSNSLVTHLSHTCNKSKRLDGNCDEEGKTKAGDVLPKSPKAFHFSLGNIETVSLSAENTEVFPDSPQNSGPAHVSPENMEAFHSSPQTTRTVHSSPKNTEAFHVSPQNKATIHTAPENTEPFHILREKSAPAFDMPKKSSADCHSHEKNDSGFVEDLSDLLDLSLNISNLNTASIVFARSPEFNLARKTMSIKEYNDRLTMMLRHFAPPFLDRLIGRKMGLEKVDIISELYFRNISGVLTSILNYLSDDDLFSMSAVSVRWKGTVKVISHARYKKNRLLQHPSHDAEHTEQENSFTERTEHRSVTKATEPLLQVQSKLEVRISARHVTNRTERFWQEASKLKNHEIQRKCSRCRNPSRVDTVQERAWCSNSKCQFDFCIKCLAPYHGLRPCIGAKFKQTAQQPEIKICSKQSKRNLRRL